MVFNRSKEMTMATAAPPKTRLAGGGFLIQEQPLDDVFTVEDLTEEHLQIAQTTAEFARNEILPNVDIPEQYGGSDMDKISSSLINEHIAVSGSFSVAFGGHVGIGTLPIVYFRTPEQKAKYLPKLASGELIAAYALSEGTSASDAM